MGKNAQRRREQLAANGKSAEDIAREALAAKAEMEEPEFPAIGLPMYFEFQQADLQDGGKAMIMVIKNSMGTFKFMMTAEGAEQLFTEGLGVARMTKSGLHIPGKG